jgi:hypothetical protein
VLYNFLIPSSQTLFGTIWKAIANNILQIGKVCICVKILVGVGVLIPANHLGDIPEMQVLGGSERVSMVT